MAGRNRKHADLFLRVTRQNVKDGIANDQQNCTFGQCELSRTHGMDFYVDVDPLDPQIWAEWIDDADGRWHRADVRRRHPDNSETMQEAITVVAATDIAKKELLKKFPRDGMDFVLTNHTSRDVYHRLSSSGKPKPGETEEQAGARRAENRERRLELERLRAEGKAEPPKRRKRRVRARFGGRQHA